MDYIALHCIGLGSVAPCLALPGLARFAETFAAVEFFFSLSHRRRRACVRACMPVCVPGAHLLAHLTSPPAHEQRPRAC